MTEASSKNAFAATVGRLGELSESELRQLYLIVGVRLGIPDHAAAGPSGQPSKGSKPSKKSSGGGKAAAPGKPSSSKKGNPSRKSQWANHPLYKEYSRLKKVVEAQAKEQKCSFNVVDTAESRAYQQAFTQWVEAKSSFRDRKTDEKEDSDEESEEEDAPPAKKQGAQLGNPTPRPADSAGPSSGGKGGNPPSPPSPGTSPQGSKTSKTSPGGKGKGQAK